MKIEVKSPLPAFQPITIELTLENENEFKALRLISFADIRVPNAVVQEGSINQQWHDVQFLLKVLQEALKK